MVPRNDTETTPGTWCRGCDDTGLRNWRRTPLGEQAEPCEDCPACCYCGVLLSEHEGDEQRGDLRPEHVRRERTIGANGFPVIELWAPVCWAAHVEHLATQRDAARDMAEVA